MTKKIAFIGSVQFAAQCLLAIRHAGVAVGQVIGWPYDPDDTPSGWMSMPCVSTYASPISTKDVNSPEIIRAVAKCDLLVCGGWSRLFKKELLEACPLGAVNLHPTLLPVGRGRAPIPWTIIYGLTRSGVTLHYMTEGCDDGDIIGQEAYDIDPDETATTLYAKATEAGQRLCREFIPRLLQGNAPRTAQQGAATIWPQRRPEYSEVFDITMDPDAHDAIWAKVRALEWPYPQAYIRLNTKNGPRKVYLSSKGRD